MTAASRDGAAALDDARAFIGRFCALPVEHAYTAVTLWAAHAWALDAFDSTPRLAFLSPEPGSGKTRALEILTLLVPWPMHAVNATPAALFRSVADPASRRTILFDEIDTIFGPKAKEHEELRGLLNAGHRRSGVAYRCVGEGTRQEVAAFPAYAAVALAGLGQLPDTILTRSVVIRMRRRAPHEYVEPYRARIHEPEGKKLGQQLGDWANSAAEHMTGAWPEMPPGVTDRPADVWEPLLTVADAAGGPWPERARAACSWLVRDNADRGISLGIRLLADLRSVFDGQPALNTADILTRLHDLDDGPWADLKGQPLDARGLSRLLSPYDITPVKVRAGGTGRPLMGYRAEHLADAWARYLPPPDGDSTCSGCSGTSAEERNAENTLWPADAPDVPDVPDLQQKYQTRPAHNRQSHRRADPMEEWTLEPTPAMPVVHTVAEAAVILHVKESWLERQAAARKIPFTMLGGSYRFTATHLAEIVRINEKRPAIPSELEATGGKPRKSPVSGTVTALRPRPRPDGPRRKRTAA